MPTSTRLIHDLPSSEDAFGSHSRVAEAIKVMILSEDGGHALALQGSWGSGKSTIVEFLKRDLQEQVFVFDAWAHEGDPLRRVFLEKLFEHCRSKLSRTKSAEWETRCFNLRARERTDERREIPALSWAGLTLVTLLMFVPIALLALHSWIGSTETQWWHYLGIIYPLIAFSPLFLRLIHRDAGETVALVVTRKIARTTTTTKETPEPTSIEFETFFCELLSDVISSEERLLIVVDNLDRVLAKHALETWSTLRVFLERMSAGKDPWCKHVWLLVPYDKTSMDRLWEANGHTSGGSSQSDARQPQKPAAFLDKTFQIRFEVPPVILADWKDYLEKLTRSAFPDHEDVDERQRVYRLSALVAERDKRPPTPRHLKLYVNDIGALRRQHNDTFPLHHMAYMTLLRRQNVDIRDGLVTGVIPPPKFREILNNDIEDHLAALLFNTDDVEKARDLLLRQPILDALASGDHAKLSELASRRGFWPLAESVLPEAPLGWRERPEAAVNAAKAVLKCELAKSDGHPEAERSVRAFAQAVSGTVVWTLLDASTGEGIAATMRLGGSEAVSRNLFQRALSDGLAELNDADIEARATQWVTGMLYMLRAAAELGHAHCCDMIRVDCEPATLVRVLAAFRIQDDNRHFWGLISSTTDGGKVLAAVAPNGMDKLWEPYKRAAVDVCLCSQIEFPWTEFASKCQQMLQSDKIASPEIVAPVLQTLRQLGARISAAGETWQALASGGHLLHHFNACGGVEHAMPGAVLIREILLHVDIAKPAPTFANAPQGLRLIKTFITQPHERSELLDAIYDLLVSDSGDELVQALIRHKAETASLLTALIELLVERSQVTKVFTSQLFVSVWQELRELLDQSTHAFDGLMSNLVQSGNLLSHLAGTTFSLSDSALLRRLLIPHSADEPAFSAWISAGLLEVNANEWLSQLRSLGEGLRLLDDYRQLNASFTLTHQMADALNSFGTDVIRGTSEIDPAHNGEIPQCISALPGNRRKVLGKDLLDIATSLSGGVGDATFSVFGEILATAIASGDNKDALRCVLKPIVQRREVGAGTWMANLFRANPTLLNFYPDEDVEDFKERVCAARDDEVDQFTDVAEQIYQALDLS